MDVARQGMTCREGGVVPWSDGMACRLHRVGVAFAAIGLWVSSLRVCWGGMWANGVGWR